MRLPHLSELKLPCAFAGISDESDKPGPKTTCAHGKTLTIETARRLLKMDALLAPFVLVTKRNAHKHTHFHNWVQPN